MSRLFKIVAVITLLALSCLELSAQQRYRGPRQVIKGGLMQKPDTLRRDSLPKMTLVGLDTAALERFVDSLSLDSLKIDTLVVDSLAKAGTPDSLR